MQNSQAKGRANTPQADTVADEQQPNTHENTIQSGDTRR